ncbi:MAG: hypothetical protein J3Q66DRAFT_267060, partial [Benniella sp.]
HRIGSMVQCNHCKAFVWIQESLKSSKASNPLFSICCQHGEVNLPPIRTAPGLLELIAGETNDSRTFRSKIRLYNSALSFTSMGVNVDRELANGREGVYTFRVCGTVVHKIGSLLPPENGKAKFAQIY